MTTVVIDQSNLMMTIRHAELPKKEKADNYGAQLIFQKTVKMICDIAKRYGATEVIHAVEGKNNWRKEFWKEYKANREIETDLYYPEIQQAREWLETFFRDFTNHSVVKVDGVEADDVIAVTTQNAPADKKYVIVSADRDFTQLIRENVRLYSPAQSKEREAEEDRDFSLFLKCIRGDRGDNITSAYPRVREKKLRQAWDEHPQVSMKNIMETVIEEGETEDDQTRVRDLYNRNRTLIDLTFQPIDLRERIQQHLDEIPNESSAYSQMGALGFFRDIELTEKGREFDDFCETLKVKRSQKKV